MFTWPVYPITGSPHSQHGGSRARRLIFVAYHAMRTRVICTCIHIRVYVCVCVSPVSDDQVSIRVAIRRMDIHRESEWPDFSPHSRGTRFRSRGSHKIVKPTRGSHARTHARIRRVRGRSGGRFVSLENVGIILRDERKGTNARNGSPYDGDLSAYRVPRLTNISARNSVSRKL